ncbi:pyridoxamine 5'-phosphate oxidase family protein [Derxia lacustris]|uniref:pyridoxamine 5'-phosphate oxidase family protein n=1 Tax=Derxia lacustris TaxID=764842 RepID=UPI000A16F509|nr:pyridoxamine 5'-phosphate oxidase family protein [Derxia lacustris]
MTDNDSHQQLWNRISGERFVMFNTVDTDGRLSSRPMTLVQKDFDGSLWFFTSLRAPLVAAVELNPSVGVTIGDRSHDLYVSMRGQARVSRDRLQMEILWQPAVQPWFPDGIDDPDIALLEVVLEDAEYWDVKESKLTQLVKLAGAVVQHQRAQLGEHGHLRL